MKISKSFFLFCLKYIKSLLNSYTFRIAFNRLILKTTNKITEIDIPIENHVYKQTPLLKSTLKKEFVLVKMRKEKK